MVASSTALPTERSCATTTAVSVPAPTKSGTQPDIIQQAAAHAMALHNFTIIIFPFTFSTHREYAAANARAPPISHQNVYYGWRWLQVQQFCPHPLHAALIKALAWRVRLSAV